MTESVAMQAQCLFRDFEYTNTLDIRRGTLEVLVDHRLVESDRFKDLRTTVGHISRDAHLREYFQQTFADRFLEVVDRFIC